jgi:predicted Zn-dependent protease
MSFLSTRLTRIAFAAICFAAVVQTGACLIDEPDENTEKLTAERFLKVLIGNPRFGTAFDRVYEFHMDRGSIPALKESLRVAAKLPAEPAAEADSATSDMVAITLPPVIDSGTASLLFGMIQLKHSEAASAIAALRQAAQQRSKDATAHWYLARAFLLNHRLDEATASLEQALECRPARTDLFEIHKELARILQRSQKPDSALATWQRLEHEFPGDLRVKEQIAAALAEDGRWDEALNRFLALAMQTRNADQRVQANLSASDLMIQLGRPQDAVGLLESQLSDLDSDSWLYRELRRRIEATFRSRNDLPGLVAYYESWLAIHAEDVDAMARLAQTLSLQNRTADASEWFRRAIQRAPSNTALRESLIEQLERENRISDAISQYEQMAQFDNGNTDHVEALGQLYLSQKDVPLADRQAKAAAVWERLLIDRLNDPVTLARVAQLMRRAESKDRAIELYQAAIQKAPDEPQYREYLGEYLQQLQRIDEAVAVWTSMAQDNRRTKPNLIRLAEVLNRFGHTELSLESMRAACSQNPDPAERMQFAEMLRNASGTAAAARLTEALEQLDLAEQSSESPTERQQILRDRVKTLIAAGRLKEQTDLLASELNAGINITADRWRTLALYQDAADNLNDATASALKVVELEPQSIPGWTILADLYERAGRLADAAEAMKKLAALDRRGISEYLKKIARLEIQLGQFDAALQTGRSLIKATPGNPEAYQYFADLAFEVGQPQVAVESLRQAVRVNPGDEASLRALAKTLADEFQTSEAIELYWRAFEKAADLESQTNIVVALSNLYLRSNQFEKLIDRLERRSRDLNLPLEMTRCIAIAWREAGDFRKSRETLEQLLIHDPANVDGLKELVVLSQQEHNLPAAIAYQQRIVQITSSVPEQRTLAALTAASGNIDESFAILVRIAESQTGRAATLTEIDSLIEMGTAAGRAVAIGLCEKLLRDSPSDWEAMFRLAGIYENSRDHQEQCGELSRRLLKLRLDWKTPVSVAGPLSGTQMSIENWDHSPTQFSQWIQQIESGPLTYGDAFCLSAERLLMNQKPEATSEDLSLVFDPEIRLQYGLRVTAYLTMKASETFIYRKSEFARQFWNALHESVTDDTSPVASVLRLRLIDCYPAAFNSPFPDADKIVPIVLADVIQNAPEWIVESPEKVVQRSVLGSGADDQTIWELLQSSLDWPNLHADNLAAVLIMAVAIEDASLTKQALNKLYPDGRVNTESTKILLADDLTREICSLFEATNDVDGLLELLTVCWESREIQSQAQPVNYLTLTVGDILIQMVGRNCYHALGNCLNSLELADGLVPFEKWATHREAQSSPLERAALNLLRAEWAMNDDFNRVLYFEILAAEAAPENQGLKLLIARSAASARVTDEAIELLDSITTTDPGLLIAKEQLALQWYPDHLNLDRARRAAERLAGLPLNRNGQVELLHWARRLGMDAQVASLEARFGRNTETRESVLGGKLRSYTILGKNELAAEVGWELLRLASGGSLFSGQRPNDDRDDGGERLPAIKALGRLKRLQPIIDRYEAMLAAAPDSVELLEVLAEFHEAAEQWDELAAKRDRIALLSKKAPPSLKAKAVALENSGDVSGACDLYLQILRDDPAAFSKEMETYVQAFERAKRHADFLTQVLSQNPDHWADRGQILVNVIASLHTLGIHPEVVDDSVKRVLKENGTRQQAIFAFLDHLEVCPENLLLPAIESELRKPADKSSSMNLPVRLSMIANLKQKASFHALLDYFQKQSDLGAVVSEAPILRVVLRAKLGEREAVLKDLQSVTEANSLGSVSDEELGALSSCLGSIGPEWVELQASLLEKILASPRMTPELREAALEDLATAYARLGRTSDARRLQTQRIRLLITAATGTASKDSSSVRALLQSAEKIQHSGFPIEAARLLLNVTSHDIDEFTSDLDDDKAIAFKSRFNASQRWARQQISAESIVSWFETAVEQSAAANGPSDLDIGDSDLLLEISGTTDPRTRDVEKLKQLRLDSVLLNAVSKQSFDSEGMRQKIATATTVLLGQETPELQVLGVALALAESLQQRDQVDALCERIALAAGSERNAVRPTIADGTRNEPTRSSSRNRIPETLRSNADHSCVLIARLLASRESQKTVTRQLLQRSATAANQCSNRLIRIAILHECAATAMLAGLTEEAAQFKSAAAGAITEQINASSFGDEGTFDLAHEIRMRLLKK